MIIINCAIEVGRRDSWAALKDQGAEAQHDCISETGRLLDRTFIPESCKNCCALLPWRRVSRFRTAAMPFLEVKARCVKLGNNSSASSSLESPAPSGRLEICMVGSQMGRAPASMRSAHSLPAYCLGAACAHFMSLALASRDAPADATEQMCCSSGVWIGA
jgi:hypothetical protein